MNVWLCIVFSVEKCYRAIRDMGWSDLELKDIIEIEIIGNIIGNLYVHRHNRKIVLSDLDISRFYCTKYWKNKCALIVPSSFSITSICLFGTSIVWNGLFLYYSLHRRYTLKCDHIFHIWSPFLPCCRLGFPGPSQGCAHWACLKWKRVEIVKIQQDVLDSKLFKLIVRYPKLSISRIWWPEKLSHHEYFWRACCHGIQGHGVPEIVLPQFFLL